jgi:hypothetical protein
MARVLVTGMSGAGKSTLLDELAHRGHSTVDTDYGGWVLAGGLWDETRMARLLADRSDLVVSGTVSNQRTFYDRFEHMVLLSAPVEVLLERVRTRRSNPYGRTSEQRAEIVGYVETVDHRCDAEPPASWMVDFPSRNWPTSSSRCSRPIAGALGDSRVRRREVVAMPLSAV